MSPPKSMEASSAIFFDALSRSVGWSEMSPGSSHTLEGAVSASIGPGTFYCSQISTRQFTSADNGSYRITWHLKDGRTLVQTLVIALP